VAGSDADDEAGSSMSEPGTVATGGRASLLTVVETACAALEASRGRIDDLNVFPVPDGDTGANMVHTARAVASALRELGPADPARTAEVVTRAALLGARGNSGIILSQLIRGGVAALAPHPGVAGAAVAEAFAGARAAGYAAVRVPVEGTMLTVIAAMADGAAAAQEGGADGALAGALAAGEQALVRTPELLPRLAEAGVVDAGGAGVVELVRGLLAGLRGEPAPVAPAAASAPAPVLDEAHDEGSEHRYCTSFLVEQTAVARDELERRLAPFGDSILVVGAAPAFRVHVHTDDPGGALRIGTGAGAIGGVEISDMHAQMAARRARLAPERACDVVFVSQGEGNRALAGSLGARTVVEDVDASAIEAAIAGTRAAAVIVLPNGEVALAAARRAASRIDRPVHVLGSRSIAEGVCALVAYLPEGALDANVAALSDVLAGVRGGELARASGGRLVASADGVPVASLDDPAAALQAVAEALLRPDSEVLTVLLGAGEPAGGLLAGAAAGLANAHPGLEVAVHEGGQPGSLALLAVE
jgi:hypothetical protein